jgi:hypothetical protein
MGAMRGQSFSRGSKPTNVNYSNFLDAISATRTSKGTDAKLPMGNGD